MHLLSPRNHGFIDYAAVAVLFLAPSLFGFDDAGAARICYALGAVQLAMSLATAYPLGLLKAIPFTVHGAIEAITAVGLVLLPFVLGYTGAERTFFIVSGLALGAVWLVTDYKAAERDRLASHREATHRA